jgi:hypothetical protein
MEKADQFFESKKEGLEQVLGPMHAVVGHSLIPYQAGGSIDMGYFCRMLPGTVITTMELIGLDGGGPQPNRFGTFELVACTRHPYQVEPGAAADPAFQEFDQRYRRIFSLLARYSQDVVLEVGDICQIPDEGGEMIHLVFDRFDFEKRFQIGDQQHNLLLCLEIYAQELAFAQEHGAEELINALVETGDYPYSDMDRTAVV